MIYGEIKDIKTYKGISEELDKAIDFIAAGKYKNPKVGKNVIDGDVIYFNCPDAPKTKAEEDGFYETHKKYIDIHVVLEGDEVIGYTDDVKVTKAYDEAGDCEIAQGKTKMHIHLDNTRFLALFPGEPHMALIKYGINPETIKKVIFKVLAK